jgi:hypothetical protein
MVVASLKIRAIATYFDSPANNIGTWPANLDHELVLVDHPSSIGPFCERLFAETVNDTPARRSIDECPFDQFF